LQLREITFASTDGLSKLHRLLKKNIINLKQGEKNNERIKAQHEQMEISNVHQMLNMKQKKNKIADSWPQLVSKDLKEKIDKMFHMQTSKASLATFTCASVLNPHCVPIPKSCLHQQ